MKIGDIAARLGTTPRTLRFYEEQGLVHPRRTAGGTRVYDARDEARFAALLTLAGLGFPLQQLKDLAGVRPGSAPGAAAAARVLAKLDTLDRALAAQAAAIAAQRADLARARALVQRCQSCAERPVRAVCDRCPVSAGVDESRVLQVVWDEPARD